MINGTSEVGMKRRVQAKRRVRSKKRVSFSISSPFSRAVSVAGSFNDWQPEEDPLKRDEYGNWTIVKYLPHGRYEYRFFVDGIWTPDPLCDNRQPNPYGGENCVIEVK
jgi:1,4-alpha-glucan branching enzyme